MFCLRSPEGGDSGFKVNRLLLQSVLHMSLRPLGKPRGNQVTATAPACFYESSCGLTKKRCLTLSPFLPLSGCLCACDHHALGTASSMSRFESFLFRSALFLAFLPHLHRHYASPLGAVEERNYSHSDPTICQRGQMTALENLRNLLASSFHSISYFARTYLLLIFFHFWQ